MNKKRASLFIVIVAFVSIVIYMIRVSPVRPITAIDYPYFLEEKKEEITVFYVRWACACPNWMIWDEKYVDEGPPENCDDCLFLESSNGIHQELLDTIDNGHGTKIKLIGFYYKEKGISRDYDSPTPEHPSYAPVFRYEDYQIIH